MTYLIFFSFFSKTSVITRRWFNKEYKIMPRVPSIHHKFWLTIQRSSWVRIYYEIHRMCCFFFPYEKTIKHNLRTITPRMKMHSTRVEVEFKIFKPSAHSDERTKFTRINLLINQQKTHGPSIKLILVWVFSHRFKSK